MEIKEILTIKNEQQFEIDAHPGAKYMFAAISRKGLLIEGLINNVPEEGEPHRLICSFRYDTGAAYITLIVFALGVQFRNNLPLKNITLWNH